MKALFRFAFSLFILNCCSLLSMAQILQPNTGTQSFEKPNNVLRMPNNTQTPKQTIKLYEISFNTTPENCIDGGREQDGSIQVEIKRINAVNTTVCLAYAYELKSVSGIFKKSGTIEALGEINGLPSGHFEISIKGCGNIKYTDVVHVGLRSHGRRGCR